jgi:hypothetical protein
VVATHEYRGLWWLPNDDAERLPGTLTVTKGAAALEVIGHFGHELLSETDRERTYSLHLAEQPRIVGMSTGGKPITLEGHRAAPHTVSLPGIATATYKRNVTLTGKQFADGEDIGFDEIAIRASDLNEWTRVSGFHSQIGIEKHQEKDYVVVFSNVGIRFEAPDDIDIALARGESAFIRFSAQSQGIGPALTASRYIRKQLFTSDSRSASPSTRCSNGLARSATSSASPSVVPWRFSPLPAIRTTTTRQDGDAPSDRAALGDPVQPRPANPRSTSGGDAFHAPRGDPGHLDCDEELVRQAGALATGLQPLLRGAPQPGHVSRGQVPRVRTSSRDL